MREEVTVSVSASRVKGILRAPPSKSLMQRAIAAACLASGKTRIFNPTYCDDGKVALQIAQALGKEINTNSNYVDIQGAGTPRTEALECGESGLSIRLFSAISALYETPLTLKASGSLQKRPLGMIVEPLRQLGVRVQTKDGFAPLSLCGPMKAGNLEIDGALTSQFLSGLLMALATCPGNSEIKVKNLKSRPYVEMTLDLLNDFGIQIEVNQDFNTFFISGPQIYRAREYTIEGDWSGAAFLLVAAALAGELEVHGLDMHSLQADRKIVEALRACGAKVVLESEAIKVTRDSLRPFHFDASDCPDLIPPLVALASSCEGESVLKGADRLVHKESNRAIALQQEFNKLGIEIAHRQELMIVQGGVVQGGDTFSHQDHRIAMACAVAGLMAKKAVTIKGAECVAKSYPGFFTDMQSVRKES